MIMANTLSQKHTDNMDARNEEAVKSIGLDIQTGLHCLIRALDAFISNMVQLLWLVKLYAAVLLLVVVEVG